MRRAIRTIFQGLGLLCSMSLSTSCATIFSASRYTVPVRSEPSGATLTILDRDSVMVFHGTTPAMVELKSSKSYFRRGIYTVHITAEDHEPFRQVVRANLSGWYWGNLFFPGLLGFFLVDPLTGAMYSLKHRYVLGQLHTTSALPAE